MAWNDSRGQNVVREIPVESPRKYGAWDDNVDDLADGLGRRESSRRSGDVAVPDLPASDSVDEDFFRTVRDSSSKYGG